MTQDFAGKSGEKKINKKQKIPNLFCSLVFGKFPI